MVTTRSSGDDSPVILDSNIPFVPEYFAEGAANVVFKIGSRRNVHVRDEEFGQPGTVTDDGTPRIDERLRGKLIRLRKDLPSVAPILESHRHFQEQIEPLFSSGTLVDQMLCEVTPLFVRTVNRGLRQLEVAGRRPKNRHGVYLAEDEPYATAVTSMLWDDQHASCEFKPKWLAQSPSAPPDSKRCRTCALRAMRQIKDQRPPQRGDYCPLTLMTDDQGILSSSLDSILGNCKGAPLDIDEFIRQLLPYFYENGLITLLRDLQVQMDPHGILSSDPSDLDFVTAMTLRDCTMFLKIPNSEEVEAHLEVRLGDLDLKIPDGNKAAYWKETEQQLIDEGWYMATEATKTDNLGATCLLSTN